MYMYIVYISIYIYVCIIRTFIHVSYIFVYLFVYAFNHVTSCLHIIYCIYIYILIFFRKNTNKEKKHEISMTHLKISHLTCFHVFTMFLSKFRSHL